MRHFLAASALATGLALPGFAAAQELSISTGFTATNRYMFYGLEQTTGAAIQPWFELEYGGLYAGVWASNTSASITGSKAEIDVYAGFRGEAGQFSYDFSYVRYYYVNPSNDCCGEFILSLGYAPSDSLGLGLRFARDPVADVNSTSGSIEYAINDRIGLSAEYGSLSNGGHDYWSVGGNYAINDTYTIRAAWDDTDITSGLFLVSLDASFSIR